MDERTGWATLVIMPRQGQSVESCIITKWHKAVGDAVAVDDVLFEYETDKAAFEEKSTVEGTMLALLAEEGDDVPCLQNVCVIGKPGDDISFYTGAAVAEAPAAAVEAPVAVAEPVVDDTPVVPEEPKKAGLNIGMLVWSIIGLVVCCSPFSIPALIMTILAMNMPVAEAEKKIKLARTFNIISIVWGVLYFMLAFIIGFLAGLAEALAFML